MILKVMYNFITVLLITLVCSTGIAQEVFGKWKTIDDKTGKAKAYIEIYEEDGKAYGTILELINPKQKDPKCDRCPDEDKDKPVVGLKFIKGLEKDGEIYSGGKILDPGNGKLYQCYITLEEEDRLKVRGYIGITLLGRTQYWERVK